MPETPEQFRMPPGHLDHAVKMLMGEVHALNLFAQALARSHPQRRILLAELDQAEPRGLASLEYIPTRDEALIEGYQFVMAAVRKALLSQGEDPE